MSPAPAGPPGADPFDTAGRRDAVLAAWASSPTRFREDANAEEDLVLGGYADRLVVELAQNAADAAVRAGVPGVLRLRYADGVLSAANTGAPLDAAGVDGLASLRASAKRGDDAGRDTVGRFGVGFAAVLAVSDEPEVRSAGGGVRFSAAATREAVAALGGAPAAEAARRDGRVPVLRLPWPVADPPPAGFDTEVRLPVRAGAEGSVAALLAAVDGALLLGLPGLSRLEVGGRVIERRPADSGTAAAGGRGDGGAAPSVGGPAGDVEIVDTGPDGTRRTRWRCVTAAGDLPADALAGRPVEERDTWSVLVAVPVDGTGRVLPLPLPQLVHAPTPSDEPLSLPLRVVASFPLDAARRRVPAGPATDFLVERVAGAVGGLAAAVAAEPSALALVPRPGLAHATLDAALCRAVLTGLREAPILPTAAGPRGDGATRGGSVGDASALGGPAGDRSISGDVGTVAAARPRAGGVAGRDAVTVDPDLAGVAEGLVPLLADAVPGLLPAAYATAPSAALAALGVRRLDAAGVVDAVTGLARPPSWWRALYAALAPVAGLVQDALGALPVPLADGRTVTGPRGTLLPGEGLPASAVAALGLRVVDADAVHPLLERLGARPATPRSLLADDRLRAEVAHALDDPGVDLAPLADAVLALVAAAGVRPGEESWLADLALPDDDGGWSPAGELLVPGSPLDGLLADDAPFGTVAAAVADRWGAAVLAAVGCPATFAILDEGDVDLVEVGTLGLDRAEEWADAVVAALGDDRPGARVERLRAVRDLEWVRPDAWPDALALLARELRDVVAAPTVALARDGRRAEVPSYTRWWLAGRPVLDGRRPGDLRTPGAAELAGLYDPADGDAELLALLGCRTSLDDVLAGPPGAVADLLDRLGDPDRTVAAPLVPLVYARIAAALDGPWPPPPERVRVAPDRVVDAGRVVVVDEPWRLAALAGREPVLGGADPAAVADLLDAPLLSEL